MPRATNLYANMRPRLPDYAAGPSRPGVQDQQATVNAAQQWAQARVGNRPNVTATFDGQPMAWSGGQNFQVGQNLPGRPNSRVMVGAQGGYGVGGPPQLGPGRAPAGGYAGTGTSGAGNGTAGGQSPEDAYRSLIPGEARKDMEEANNANLERYGEGKGILQQSKRDVLGTINGGYDALLKRQQEIAGGLRDKFNTQSGEILGLVGQDSTGAAMERERRHRENQLGRTSQSAINRGITNTTVVDSLNRGIEDDSRLREEEIQNAQRDREVSVRQNLLAQMLPTEFRLNEAETGMMQNRIGQTVPAMQQADRDLVGFIERRQDEGPNMALYSQLLAQEGANRNALAQIQAQSAAQQGTNAMAQYQSLLQEILSRSPAMYQGGGQPNGMNTTGGFRRPNQAPAQGQYNPQPTFANQAPNSQPPRQQQADPVDSMPYETRQRINAEMQRRGIPVNPDSFRQFATQWYMENLNTNIADTVGGIGNAIGGMFR